MSKCPEITLALAAVVALFSSSALGAGDADAGKSVFNGCRSCHAVGEGAANKVGPQLNEIIGRTAGTAADYSYSKAMQEAGADGLTWDDASLSKFLQNPKGTVKGTKMAFAGLKKDDDVANVIAYLSTFSPTKGASINGAPPATGNIADLNVAAADVVEKPACNPTKIPDIRAAGRQTSPPGPAKGRLAP